MIKRMNHTSLIFALGALMLFVPVSVSFGQDLMMDSEILPPPDEPDFDRNTSPVEDSNSKNLGIMGLPEGALTASEPTRDESGIEMDLGAKEPREDFFFDPMATGSPLYDSYNPEIAAQEMMNAKGQNQDTEFDFSNEESVPTTYTKQSINPNAIPSLLFSVWEYNTLQDAQRNIGRTLARPTEDFEVGEEEPLFVRPDPESRNISLAGIVYGGRKNWTIWLNGQRVTPKALPEEILDLKVYREYIEIKWFDNYTRGIFPIRLKPHQRFNLDSRIFLPG